MTKLHSLSALCADAENQRQHQIVRSTRERIRTEEKRCKRVRFNKGVSKFKQAIKSKNRAIRRLRNAAKKAALKKTSHKSAISVILDTVQGMLSQSELTLLKTHLQNTRQKKKTYSEAYKQLVISISFKSTSCYTLLSNRLNFPPKRTVSRWLSHIRFQERFDPNLFNLLRARTSKMTEQDRIVTLLADEVSLKELCDYDIQEDKVFGVKRSADGKLFYPSSAMVLMVTGVRAKWRQAIAFFFTKNAMPAAQLSEVVFECVTKLQESGLTVVNFTSDQGSNFSSLLKSLGVSEKRPFFTHNDNKIFVTPDPPHLLKSIRNALMGHSIVTSDGTASWQHLQKFFEIERAQTVRTAPKLRNEHIEPPAIYGKMNVRLAAQVFSHSVAAGMRSFVAANFLPREALPTSEFCMKINHIFDVLNSSQKSAILPFQTALTVESQVTLAFIDEAIVWLKSFQIFDKKGKVVNSNFRCIEGTILALTSVKHLVYHLHEKAGFRYLLTRRLCQDSLENYFALIRQKNGFNANPSCLAFTRSYKITQCC